MIHIIMDLIGLAGIAMLGYGLWLVGPSVMFCVLGFIFIFFAMLSEAGFVVIRNPYKPKG